MKVLLLFVSVSTVIVGSFAQSGTTPTPVDWLDIQADLDDTVATIHYWFDQVGELATAANPAAGRLVVETLKTSLQTIDPILADLVNAAKNEVLTEEVIKAQYIVLQKLLSDAYQELLVPMIPLPSETIKQIIKIFGKFDPLIEDTTATIIGLLDP